MSTVDTTKTLTTGQRNRLMALARAGQSLPSDRSDDVLLKKRLVRKYRGPLVGEFAGPTSDGLAVAQFIARD